MTDVQEQAIREQASKELYWGPKELRGHALRWLKEANQALEAGQTSLAARYTLLSANLQSKATELEARALVKGLRT